MSCKHTFGYTPDPDNPYDVTSVEVTSSVDSLDRVLEAMEAYLLACGFVFPDGCHVGLEDRGMVGMPE